jgi:hypothetical protein
MPPHASRSRCSADAGALRCGAVADGAAPWRATDAGSRDAGPAKSGEAGADSDAAPGGVCGERAVPNPIVVENRRRGSSAWRITVPSASSEIEGYASTTSAAAGDAVAVMVSASRAGHASWALYRLGYYGGAGARLVTTGGPVGVSPQAECATSSTTGMVECDWPPTFSVVVDPAWVTGQYLFKLTRADGFESYVPLVVREAAPRAPMLFQSSVTTWQAYNTWGGSSLYLNLLPSSAGFDGPQAYKVSFDRPYEFERPVRQAQPEVEWGAGQLFLSEIWMLTWLEKQGYDMAYLTNLDVDATPEVLDGRRMFLDAGHDEYWTRGERKALEAARDAGVSLGFFSANSAYWRVRLEPSSSGTARRIVTCYKDASIDPTHNAPDTTMQWRAQPYPDPEARLLGQMYQLWTNLDSFPLVVREPWHWIFRDTGLVAGDTLSHVVGYEWDRIYPGNGTPDTLESMADSPTFGSFGSTSGATVTAYYPTASSVVFAAGSITWAWGLGKPDYADTRVSKITENVLDRAGMCPAAPIHVVPPPEPTDVGDAAEVTLVAGTGHPGHKDGPAASAEFDSPAGVAADAAGTIYVTEAHNHSIRRILPDRTVSTLAGCGPDATTNGSFADGTGTAACFSVPTGIVVGPDGNLVVSDTGNRRIRLVTPEGVVTTYGGDGTNQRRDGPLAQARFQAPRGLAFGPDGSLYVADYRALRRITKGDVTTLAYGTEVSAVAVAQDGTVYAVLTSEGSIVVAKDGVFVPVVNASKTFGDRAGPGSDARLRPADGLLLDGNRLIVSDSANYKIRRVAIADGYAVTTFVGSGLFGTAIGTGATARVVNPRGLGVLGSGYLIADSGNHRVLLAKP